MAEEPNSETPSSVHLDENGSEGEENQDNLNVQEQEQFLLLPLANISQIMKKASCGNSKISKNAKEMMQECVSEFIGFVTNEASAKCDREKRKTINSDDLLWAMNELGFANYVKPLKIYLDKYREVERGGHGSMTNKPRNANFENKEGVGPSMTPAAQMGHASAYESGMPSMPPQMPQTMAPNGYQINMPHQMPQTMVPDSYQLNLSPPMLVPDSYQFNMPLPPLPTMAPNNYQFGSAD